MNTSQPEHHPAGLPGEPASEIPNGPAAAAILSAAIGCFSVSLLGLLGDAIPSLAHFFIFYPPTGPLSGVTTAAIAIWLVLWWILSRFWSHRTLAMCRINVISFSFLGMGFLLSYPPLGDFLQGK